jgi:hypothetical protein
MSILSLKLETFKGNFDELVKIKPSLCSFFVMTESKLEFKFSQPGPIHGVKSKGKALMKMSKCTFTYPVCGGGGGCGCESRGCRDCCGSWGFGIRMRT